MFIAMIRVARPYSKKLGSDRLQIVVRHQNARRVKTKTFTIEGTRDVAGELRRIRDWYLDLASEQQAAADRPQGAVEGDGDRSGPKHLAVAGSAHDDGGR